MKKRKRSKKDAGAKEFPVILTMHFRCKGDREMVQEHIANWAKDKSMTSYGSPYWSWSIDRFDVFSKVN